MSTFDDDEFDSGDDLFDGVTAEQLVQKPAVKHERDLSIGMEALNPTKKARIEPENAEDQSRLRLAEKILAENFGYKSFRHEQKAAINRILAGKNALVVFPTGAGKSLCYQIPAIAFPELDRQTNERHLNDSGISIVVSPLIALMKDQVDALKKKGIAAECIDSTKTREELQEINNSLREGKLRLLYCAPERLNNEGFVEMMKRVKGGVRLIGVDEAHFARFVKEIYAERVICLTATATPVVVDDICEAFSIDKEGVFMTSMYRPNLILEAKAMATKQDKYEPLFEFLRTHSGSTLVYVTVQRQAEALAHELTKSGFPAHFFHAGMKVEEKKKIQDEFMASKIQIVVATIAFGMGIDKSDIRNIVHWDIPNTVEEYCQQVGRAGRDGEQSHCVLYLCPEDFYIKETFARGDLPSRNSLHNLLMDIFDTEVVTKPVGDTFKASHYHQGAEFDIRQSPLSVIYAMLELRFNLIRAVTPEYSSYKFEATPSYFPRLKNDKSPEAKAILDNARKARKYHTIDPSEVASLTGLSRMEIVKILNDLNDSGAIILTVGGVEQKYKILKELPSIDAQIDALTDEVYATLQVREKQALERIQQVIKFITGRKCFGLSIAEHFGMSLPDGKKKCGHCTFCLSGKAVELPPSPPKTLNRAAIREVLNATDVRDDARFLARVAFGIKSPRVTKLKLDRNHVFSSMADSNFEMILKEFEKACDE
ncbi:hypothetical protein CEP54_007507 [Fusarium duplospermum]|uniref:DNA 3'-5' helicase n=1 Tax=Fusarium duplospermum TaxID=1325734 RepID=A0A428Q150_9HYPO|nr:hypothetical protein CEP54_007507 [Fusarium duplospermum]